MKTAAAGANVVNAVSSSVNPVIHMDTLLVIVTSIAGVITAKIAAASASALPALAWALALAATEQTKDHTQMTVVGVAT